MNSEAAQSLRLVERGVERVKQAAGRMVDVEQDGVETPPRVIRVEAGIGLVNHRKKIAVHKYGSGDRR